MGFYVHSTNSIKMGMWGGIGTILTMNNSVLTCQSTLTTTTTNNNVLVSYFLPTPYSNGSTPVNQVSTDIVNLCVTTPAGFAPTQAYLIVKCSDIANYMGTIVTLSSQGYYWSGSNRSNSIVLDSSYNTNGPGPKMILFILIMVLGPCVQLIKMVLVLELLLQIFHLLLLVQVIIIL